MKTKKLFGMLALTIAALGISLHSLTALAAGSATLSLSPASGSYVKNSTLSVIIYATSSDPVNVVQTNLSYDAGKLTFTGITTSGSAYGLEAEGSGGAGQVRIARGVTGGGTVTGQTKVATVSFTVLGESGTTAISFANDSAILRSTDNADIWNHATAAGSYTLTAPPVTPPSTPAPTPAPTSTGGGSSTPKSNAGATTTPTTTAAPTAAPADQPVATSDTPQLTSHLVAIKVVDKAGGAVKGASVRLGGQTEKTDDTGVASFVGIAVGNYKAIISIAGQPDVVQAVVVADGTPNKAQQFTLTAAKTSSGTSKGVLAGAGGVVLLAVLGLSWFYFMRPRRGQPVTVPAPLEAPTNDATPASSLDERLANFKPEVPSPSGVIQPDNTHRDDSSTPL